MDMATIQQLLRQVDADIAEVEERLSELQAIRAYILRLNEHPPQESEAEAAPQSHQPDETLGGRFSKLSAAKAAVIVLREHGKPMHIKQLIRAVLAGGYPSTPRKVRSTLSTNMHRQPGLFEKVGRATFGLTEWHTDDHRESDDGGDVASADAATQPGEADRSQS